MIVAWM